MRETAPIARRSGFTLLEVILVIVMIVIISGITVPYYAGTFRGMKLRTAARTIDRMARHARSLAILREETMVVVIDPEKMETYLGSPMGTSSGNISTNAADGEIDQDSLKRLGYVEGEESGAEAPDTGGINKEIHRKLPDGLSIKEFNKDILEEDEEFALLYLVRFYANGQCEWFEVEIEDGRGMGVLIENDPVSGKIRSEFTQ